MLAGCWFHLKHFHPFMFWPWTNSTETYASHLNAHITMPMYRSDVKFKWLFNLLYSTFSLSLSLLALCCLRNILYHTLISRKCKYLLLNATFVNASKWAFWMLNFELIGYVRCASRLPWNMIKFDSFNNDKYRNWIQFSNFIFYFPFCLSVGPHTYWMDPNGSSTIFNWFFFFKK